MKIYWELFSVFMRTGVLTPGGGYTMLPLIRKEIVDKKRWATEEEIMDCYAAAQCTPGIIMVSTTTFIGLYEKGVLGAIIATLGVIAPGTIIILSITSILTTYFSLTMVQHALASIHIAVCVLVLNAVVKLWKNGIKDTSSTLLFVVALSTVIFTSVSTALVVIIAVLFDVIACAFRRREVKE